MKFKSALLTSTSGSIGGMTGSHNRSGMYLRARSIPVNPNSSRQIDTRAALAAAVGVWNGLTNPQRDAWNLYASNVTVTNALGDSVKISGQNWVVAAYTAATQAAVVINISQAPAIFDRGQPPILLDTTAVDVSTGISLAFDDTQEWANTDGSTLLVYAGRPQSPGTSFFKGPFRFAGIVAGDGTTPPTSPHVFAPNPFAVQAGQKQWLAARVLYGDGRLSSQVIIGPITTVA